MKPSVRGEYLENEKNQHNLELPLPIQSMHVHASCHCHPACLPEHTFSDGRTDKCLVLDCFFGHRTPVTGTPGRPSTSRPPGRLKDPLLLGHPSLVRRLSRLGPRRTRRIGSGMVGRRRPGAMHRSCDASIMDSICFGCKSGIST